MVSDTQQIRELEVKILDKRLAREKIHEKLKKIKKNTPHKWFNREKYKKSKILYDEALIQYQTLGMELLRLYTEYEEATGVFDVWKTILQKPWKMTEKQTPITSLEVQIINKWIARDNIGKKIAWLNEHVILIDGSIEDLLEQNESDKALKEYRDLFGNARMNNALERRFLRALR